MGSADDRHQELLDRLRARREDLEALLERVGDLGGEGEDLLYRFWHHSLKVFTLQQLTEQIAAGLGEVGGEAADLHEWYRQIVAEGSGHRFTLDDNDRWLQVARPVVEAYLHSLHLLRLAVHYATMTKAPQLLPSGWATLLHLYRLR